MTENVTVIGIQGMLGCGKSTVRDILVKEFGAQWVPMSGPIKWMLAGLGLSEEQLYGSQKEEPSDLLCGKTTRYGLQTLGTEWGRELIGPDIWMNAVRHRILEQARGREDALFVVVDDVRFPNEAAMVEELGGQLWTVRRPEVEYSADIQMTLRNDHAAGLDVMSPSYPVHQSERWWAVAPANVIIHNIGTQDELYNTVRDTMRAILVEGVFVG